VDSADGACGFPGAQQVAGVDHVDGLARGERAGQALGLPAPGVVQRNVELALDARVHVPGGLAVADGDDAGGVHGGGESVAV
jgi:hypothetical protein